MPTNTSGSKLLQLLAVIPVICMWTLANVIIASTLAGLTFIQLMAVAGWSKQASLGAAILVAVAVFIYIWLQPKIRSFIARSQ
jgi:hypothetical protein